MRLNKDYKFLVINKPNSIQTKQTPPYTQPMPDIGASSDAISDTLRQMTLKYIIKDCILCFQVDKRPHLYQIVSLFV